MSREETTLPFTLQNKIVEFLMSLPTVDDRNAQMALLYNAGLDTELQHQIHFESSPVQFFQLLVPILCKYGMLEDGRNAVEAVLESAKTYVGHEGRTYCDTLIRELHTVSNVKKHPHSNTPSILFPKPRENFTGRDVELAKFKEYLSRPYPISIEGLGGIGKTEFSAQSIKHFQLEDRVIWFDCTTESTFDSLLAMTGCSELLKIEHETEHSKYSGFIDVLEQGEKIVFLDDFQEIRDPCFTGFLQFAERRLQRAKIILITRIHPTGILTLPIQLCGLDDDNALKYARRIIETFYPEISISDEELKTICEKPKGHPLAIQLAIQLLYYGELPERIIRAIVEDEDEEQLAQRLLDEIFIHPKSTVEEKEFMLIFSVFRGKVSKHAINHLFKGKNIGSIRRKLMQKFMITYDHTSGFYETHPLVYEFCYKRFPNKQAWHQKAVEYFTTERTEKFDPILEEKIYYHLLKSEQWDEVADFICENGEQFIRTGHITILEEMINKVRIQGVSPSKFYIFDGMIADIKGKWEDALHYFKLSFSSPETEEKVQVEGIIEYGNMLWAQGAFQESLSYSVKGYEMCKQMNNLKGMADALNNMGVVFTTQGQLQKALEKYTESLKISEELRDKAGIAVCVQNIGSIFSTQGNFDEALENYMRSLTLKRELDDKLGIANSLRAIGSLFEAQGDLDGALEKYTENLQIEKEIGNKLGLAVSLNNIGCILVKQGDFKEALKKHYDSLTIREELNDKSGIAISLNNIGYITQIQQNFDEALEIYQKSLTIRQEIGDTPNIAMSYHNIGVIYKQQHKTLLALYNLFMSQAIQNQVGITQQKTIQHILDIKQDLDLSSFREIAQEAFSQIPENIQSHLNIEQWFEENITN